MDTNKIQIDERFNDMELFAMFNVDCNPNAEQKETRVAWDESEYATNDIKVPLWKLKKRQLTRGEKKALQGEDNIKPGISQEKPGSKRVADLARFYDENETKEKSAFFA